MVSDVREVIGEADARQALDLIAWRWKIEQDAIMHLYAINEHFRVGTPEARGNGLAGHLVLWSLHEARAEGCSTSVLHSSPMAVNLYRRMGFESVAPFTVYASADWEPELPRLRKCLTFSGHLDNLALLYTFGLVHDDADLDGEVG